MEILKNFIVFEGADGSGTSTQLNLLKSGHKQQKSVYRGLEAAEPVIPYLSPPFYKTCEPTEGSIGRLIRQGLRKEINLTNETIAMLFAADRMEHLYKPGGVVERCNRGEIVVSDRYVLSSLVYQGITCGEELPQRLNQGFPGPELLLFFELDPQTAQNRMAGRPEKEIYETLDFQIEVCRRYKAILPCLAEQGVKVEILDASKPPDEVADEVWSHIRKMPIFIG